MKLNPIQVWLRSAKDYDEGVLLLKRYRPNDPFFRLKNHANKSDYTAGKLVRAMRNIQYTVDVEKTKPRIPPLPKELVMTCEVPARSKKEDQLYPPEVEQAMLERRGLANKRDKLANSLLDIKTDDQRKRVRAEIEQLHAEIQLCNDIIGTWERTKQVLVPTPPPPLPPPSRVEREAKARKQKKIPLHKQLANARSNRSKKLARLNAWREKEGVSEERQRKNIEKYQKEAAFYDDEVKRIEKLMQDEKETEKDYA